MNILENAIRHADGMTTLDLIVRPKDCDAIFTIKDDGCGIPKDKLPGIFTGYLGNDVTVADRSKGSMHIGLSLCAAIIKAHGGEIWAVNNPDKGASFNFSLAMEVSDNEQQQIQNIGNRR